MKVKTISLLVLIFMFIAGFVASYFGLPVISYILIALTIVLDLLVHFIFG